MIKNIVAIWCLATAVAPQGFGWGFQGHRAIARIAERYLGERARQEAAALLGPETNLVLSSTWADEIRKEKPESGPWHYVNIPVMAKRTGEIGSYCSGGECLPAVIPRHLATVRDGSAPREERVAALKFLIHFLSDLHQPLHTGDRMDRGGNDTKVEYFGQFTDLHRIWDTGILERMARDDEALAALARRELNDRRERNWSRGEVEDWLWESHGAARAVAYGKLPKGSTPRLDQRYQREAEKVVRTQMAKAGLRLARVLNEIWP